MGPFYKLHIENGDMEADITPSSAISTRMVPAMCVHLSWTGTGSPVGNIIAQVSTQLEEPSSSTGDWVALDTTAYQQAAGGGAGSAVWQIPDVGFNWFRVFYDRSSAGTGALLTVKVSGKVMG